MDTKIRNLNEENENLVLKTSSIDSFLMSVKKPLGQLNYLKIWHDNSGKGDMASWFLKHIIVRDLQTKEKFYFICEQWMAVEKEDGKLEREIFVAGQQQMKNLKFLLEKQTKHQLNDTHLWLSIFNRPVHSTFTRVERVTCGFVFLYISMMFNILYFEKSSQGNILNKVDFILFTITYEQVRILNSLSILSKMLTQLFV